MDNEFEFKTMDDRRYAPSSQSSGGPDRELVVDEELARNLAKIPDRMGFKIGDVAEITQIKAYVLRFWESEFEALKPEKSKNNQRIYTRKEVELIFMIKKLLYRDRFSIEGARAALKRLKKDTKTVKAIQGTQEHLESAKLKLEELILRIQRVRTRFENP